MLGQQVSVAAARTLAGRLAERLGAPLDRLTVGVTHLFPTPEQVADASLDGLGLTSGRAETIRRLAELVALEKLDLTGSVDLGDTLQVLGDVPGVGAWTCAYIAMRALRDPDAFPAEDLGVRRAFDALGLPSEAPEIRARADRWRPWRAYAVMHLWLAELPIRRRPGVCASTCEVSCVDLAPSGDHCRVRRARSRNGRDSRPSIDRPRRELQRDTSGVVSRVARTGRPTFVTNRGEPVAAVVPVDLEALEDFVLANAPSFVRAMREADRDLAAGRTRDSAEVFAELDALPAPAARRNRAIHASSPSAEKLSRRELDVLRLIADGLTTRQVGECLHIAPRTVKTHLERILDKLSAAGAAHTSR